MLLPGRSFFSPVLVLVVALGLAGCKNAHGHEPTHTAELTSAVVAAPRPFLYSDDCKDEAFTKAHWESVQATSGGGAVDACAAAGRFTMPERGSVKVEIEFARSGGVTVEMVGVKLAADAQAKTASIGWAAQGTPEFSIDLPEGNTTVRLELTENRVEAFVGPQHLGTLVSRVRRSPVLTVEPTGRLSSIKIW